MERDFNYYLTLIKEHKQERKNYFYTYIYSDKIKRMLKNYGYKLKYDFTMSCYKISWE